MCVCVCVVYILSVYPIYQVLPSFICICVVVSVFVHIDPVGSTQNIPHSFLKCICGSSCASILFDMSIFANVFTSLYYISCVHTCMFQNEIYGTLEAPIL